MDTVAFSARRAVWAATEADSGESATNGVGRGRERNKGDIMSVTKLGAFRGTTWRQLFAELLLKSSPELNPDAADELSDSQFVALAALTPEEAVTEYLATDASRRTTTPNAQPFGGNGGLSPNRPGANDTGVEAANPSADGSAAPGNSQR
jgi:hypothetical protein